MSPLQKGPARLQVGGIKALPSLPQPPRVEFEASGGHRPHTGWVSTPSSAARQLLSIRAHQLGLGFLVLTSIPREVLKDRGGHRSACLLHL